MSPLAERFLKAYLDEVPVLGSLGDLVSHRTARCPKQHQLFGFEMDHVKKSLQPHSRITL